MSRLDDAVVKVAPPFDYTISKLESTVSYLEEQLAMTRKGLADTKKARFKAIKREIDKGNTDV